MSRAAGASVRAHRAAQRPCAGDGHRAASVGRVAAEDAHVRHGRSEVAGVSSVSRCTCHHAPDWCAWCESDPPDPEPERDEPEPAEPTGNPGELPPPPVPKVRRRALRSET